MILEIKKFIRKIVRNIFIFILDKASIKLPPWAFGGQEPLSYYPNGTIHDVCTFSINQLIEGDFLEFGVHSGSSFIIYYQQYMRILEQYIDDDREKFGRLSNTRFFAFDSFKGLPAITESLDKTTNNFTEGEYHTEKEEFLKNCQNAGVPSSRLVVVEGFYEHSLNSKIYKLHNLKQAAIISIDCDLYSSTKETLAFVTPLLQNGTIIVFNDWVTNFHSPEFGEQRAFHEWRLKNPELKFSKYIASTGWNFTAFIVHKDCKYWPSDFQQIV